MAMALTETAILRKNLTLAAPQIKRKYKEKAIKVRKKTKD